MIARYAVLSQRILQELAEIEAVVTRVERAMSARNQGSEQDDLFLDAAALNLHDLCAGLERMFRRIGVEIDSSVPIGADWHRDLLQQVSIEVPGLRPAVLSTGTAKTLDDYLRFRHVVRNIYAFELGPERVQRLALGVRPVFLEARASLLTFTGFLEDLSHQG